MLLSIFFKRNHLLLTLCTKVFPPTSSKSANQSTHLRGRFLHLSSSVEAKSFRDTENEKAHAVMESIPSYSDSVKRHPAEDVSAMPNSQKSAFKDFTQVTGRALSLNLNLEDVKLRPMVELISGSLAASADSDIVHLLWCLCLWPPTQKTFTPHFKMLWNGLDAECCKRLSSWPLSQKLLVSDYWFHLRLNRISQYNQHLICDLLQNLAALTDQQVVQLMFLINLQRKVPFTPLSTLERRLPTVLHSVSIEEVGIVCLGYFKTENKIANFEIIKLIITRFIKEANRISNATSVAILKFLKKSMSLSNIDSYVPLLHRSVPLVPNWDVLASVHLSLLAAECHLYHPLLLDKVTENVSRKLSSARIKDCMKLLQCLSHFNHLPDHNFHNIFFSKILCPSSKKEIIDYPRDLIFSTLYQSYLGIYNYDILNMALSPDFVNYCCQKIPETEHAFAEIDYCIAIECKDYTGHRLQKDRLVVLNGRRGNLIGKNTFTVMTNGIISCLKNVLESQDNILVKHVLPHMFSPDIIIRLSDRDKTLADLYSDFPEESILSPPDGELWICFVLGLPFSFAYKSKHLIGASTMKMRQLEKLGYVTVFVPYYEWPHSLEFRKKYIKEKIDAIKHSHSLKLANRF